MMVFFSVSSMNKFTFFQLSACFLQKKKSISTSKHSNRMHTTHLWPLLDVSTIGGKGTYLPPGIPTPDIPTPLVYLPLGIPTPLVCLLPNTYSLGYLPPPPIPTHRNNTYPREQTDACGNITFQRAVKINLTFHKCRNQKTKSGKSSD